MPRRLFKKLSRQRHHLRTRWFMKPFQSILGDAAYWSLNRRNVTRAVALGLFIAFLPPFIPHTLMAILLAIVLRLNIPVTLAAIFITNPVTMVPLYYAAYWLGCHVLGISTITKAKLLAAGSHGWLATLKGPILEPFVLGCLLLGVCVALVGYIVLGLTWHLSLVYNFYKRKRLRRIKEAGMPPR
jgi:uncharacterized protein